MIYFKKKLNILPITKLYHNQILIFMFKVNHKMLPEIFISMFSYVNETHQYLTRNRLNFSVPQMRLTTTKKTIRYMGVKLWNYYIQKIENSKTIHIFKKRIKTYLHHNTLPVFLH
jgi:hypothetical protein